MKKPANLLVTFNASQQRLLTRQCRADVLNKIDVIEGESAICALCSRHWNALLIDLTHQPTPGLMLIDRVLAAGLIGTFAPPALLLACSATLETLNPSLLRLNGFDRLLPLPITDTLPGSAPPMLNLSELNALAGGQQAVVNAMIPVLIQTLNDDIQHLASLPAQAPFTAIADIAHRMKSSWHLLGMSHARRSCIIMERLPALLDNGVINTQESEKMRINFISALFASLRQCKGLLPAQR
ncbi:MULTISPECIES: Hpt domain-containing protein [Kosakonia]|uniref:Hpt domain-containing protein n=1 Tax=Kosakonia TaxID=1330547 RepID=UPI0019090503|nr:MULTISPECIES: Hpt domain-containing protein [unclassified Kosakonia]MBK0081834.1 Hpt domain-containing protein [Kosakonia sp. S57]MBK0088730.1 Hpt domain-containing protein [Kosakonia sp. S58]